MYRVLLLLYPPRFRREYRDPMVQLYHDQRRDRGARAWFTVVRDLLTTLPVRYQEAFRTMSMQAKLVTAAIVITVAIVMFAAVGGALLALALMLALAWILTVLLKQRGATPPRGFWWKLTASGLGMLVLAFVVFGLPWPDSWREAVPGELAWWSGFAIVSTSIVLVVVGLLAGVTELASRRRVTR